ncbi:dimethylamine monooxygenase subunit DmmA family protein [Nesterenkonia muleiensis]|uniref:dimethylamine monooxygenase subunit DmmA family protein n=1 Tax=Nesterenkonia muleiensis TaxID=2282648 RepID=UPI000E70B375|nr:dimethylamine monooxygenase subunit DmmA family protein [Nesterenkonia muleiensis]
MPTLEQTSVPAWAVATAGMPLDRVAARAALVTFASDQEPRRTWGQELDHAGIPYDLIDLSEASKADIRQAVGLLIDSASVGFRLMLHGPLAPVLAARAAALEHSLLDEEIIVCTTEVSEIPLYCVHCTGESVVRAAIDDVVTCLHCGTDLLVYYHVSRRQGSFLGFKHDAEAYELTGAGEAA